MTSKLKYIDNFPYPYFQYGSKSSTDIDVIIAIPKEIMPKEQEARKHFIKALLIKYHLEWNATLAVFENGIMTDTIYTKSWIDSLNNAFFTTHKFHKQYFKIPVSRMLKRNKTLAIYKCARTVLTFLTRTFLRKEIKPILKGIHPFELKLKIISKLDFSIFEDFNQPNTNTSDIWKIFAFYFAQNLSLIQNNLEIYTKESVLLYYPQLKNFINRQPISNEDKAQLNKLKEEWFTAINQFGVFTNKNEFLYCNNEVIDCKNEKC